MQRATDSGIPELLARAEELTDGRDWDVLRPVVLARWLVAVAVIYAILFADASFPRAARPPVVGGILLLNAVVTDLFRRRLQEGHRWLIVAIDVATVTSAMWVLGGATGDMFLLYLMVIAFGALLHGAVAAAYISVATAAIYAVLLYRELGPLLWLEASYMGRLALLAGIGIFFGIVAEQIKMERDRTRTLRDKLRTFASHTKYLTRDKFRLRVLSEIGRLGLESAGTPVSQVLFEISKRVQQALGVSRCSLVVLERDGSQGYVAASSDDARVEIRTLKMEQYPELQATFEHGEITEVHPENPPELWRRICEHLPDVNPFSSFLVVPIKARDTLFGVFYLRDRRPDRSFEEDERAFCWAASMMTASFIRGRDLLYQLREQSRCDVLTGLLNFQAFTEEAHAVLRDDGTGPKHRMSLVVADMDNLKEINDLHGHVAGNLAITEVGRRLREHLPESVAICRYGGDEFVALVRASRRDTARQLQELLDEMSALVWTEPFDLRASVGIAEYPTDGRAPDVLLEAADHAMYLAKSAGGHRIHTADRKLDKEELYDAVVSVQTRRLIPDIMEEFRHQLNELQRRAILGLRSPLVKQSIDALMQAVESKDPKSSEHSRKVAALSRAVAQKMGLNEEQCLKIEIAGFLHDVGKIKIAEEILTKEGRLTASEREAVRRIPEEGARLLEALPSLRGVAELVRSYQECWDGSGFPEGLRGRDISVGAQIVGICDAYQALVSERAQRPRVEEHIARRLIRHGVAKRWNPRVAHAFLAMLPEDGSTWEPESKTHPVPAPELQGQQRHRTGHHGAKAKKQGAAR